MKNMFLRKNLLQTLIILNLRDRHFNQQQNCNTEGFTLVELLVGIVIVVLLAAVALPSYLNQTQKARFAEAKSYVLNMNRLQQAYYMEKGSFTDDIRRLSLGHTSSSSYSYIILVGDINGNASPPQIDRIVTNVAKPHTSNIQTFAGVVGITLLNAGKVEARTIYCSSATTGASNNAFGKIGSDGISAECPVNFYPF